MEGVEQRSRRSTLVHEPSGHRPYRVARIDQYLATANTRLDELLSDYQKIVDQDGSIAAANVTALAMRLGFEHADVAWMALVAMQRLHAQQQTAD